MFLTRFWFQVNSFFISGLTVFYRFLFRYRLNWFLVFWWYWCDSWSGHTVQQDWFWSKFLSFAFWFEIDRPFLLAWVVQGLFSFGRGDLRGFSPGLLLMEPVFSAWFKRSGWGISPARAYSGVSPFFSIRLFLCTLKRQGFLLIYWGQGLI